MCEKRVHRSASIGCLGEEEGSYVASGRRYIEASEDKRRRKPHSRRCHQESGGDSPQATRPGSLLMNLQDGPAKFCRRLWIQAARQNLDLTAEHLIARELPSAPVDFSVQNRLRNYRDWDRS